MYSSLCLRFLALTSMKFLVVLNDMNAIFCPRHKGVEWLTLPTNESRDVLFVLNAIKINYLSAICLKRFRMENLCSTRLELFESKFFQSSGSLRIFRVIWWFECAWKSYRIDHWSCRRCMRSGFRVKFVGCGWKTSGCRQSICKYPSWSALIRLDYSNYFRECDCKQIKLTQSSLPCSQPE